MADAEAVAAAAAAAAEEEPTVEVSKAHYPNGGLMARFSLAGSVSPWRDVQARRRLYPFHSPPCPACRAGLNANFLVEDEKALEAKYGGAFRANHRDRSLDRLKDQSNRTPLKPSNHNAPTPRPTLITTNPQTPTFIQARQGFSRTRRRVTSRGTCRRSWRPWATCGARWWRTSVRARVGGGGGGDGVGWSPPF